MSQHDFSIANQGFPSFRSDLNDALQALVSNSSGATEPTTTYAHQMWVDTTADPSILKIRNADNDAWITLGNIDQTGDTFIYTPAAGSASAPAYSTSGDLNTGVFFPGADIVALTAGGTEKIRANTSGIVIADDATISGLTVGRGAGAVSTNTAVGASALDANTTGASNVALGVDALGANTTASSNTAVGYAAGYSNTTGTQNNFLGYQSGYSNTTGGANTVMGHNAFYTNTTGFGNSAFGLQVLQKNTTANYNTAVGYAAAQENTTGTENVAIGSFAFDANTTGSYNTAVGKSALSDNTTGSYNSAFGTSALANNTTASNNTAVGYQAGYTNQTGTENTFVGYLAGYTSNYNGEARNTAVGRSAGYGLTTGRYNTFIGAGPNGGSGEVVTTGSKNTILGSFNGNQGGLDIRTSNNNIVLSDGDGNPRLYDRNGSTYSPSIYNVATSGGSTVSIGASHLLFRNTSSLRYKKNVVDTSRGLSDVMKLRAVQYESKSAHEEGRIFGGLIAEEIHDAGLTEFVEYNSEGQPDAVHYANMVSLAFKAIQELKSELDTVKAELATLKGN